MAQVLASRAAASLSQVAAGRRSSTASGARATPPQRLVVNAAASGQFYGGNRFRQQQQQRRGSWSQACRPQGFGGPKPFGPFGAGFGMGVSPADIQQMMQELEKWTNSAPGGQPSWGGRSSVSGEPRPLWFPTDISEAAETYTFFADLPGVSRADTKVQANKEERKLTISGTRASPGAAEEQRRRRGERKFGKFMRSWKLPEDADLSGITAAFKDGVLAVTVKRVKPIEPEVEDVPIDDWFDVTPAENGKSSGEDEPFADDE